MILIKIRYKGSQIPRGQRLREIIGACKGCFVVKNQIHKGDATAANKLQAGDSALVSWRLAKRRGRAAAEVTPWDGICFVYSYAFLS